MRVRVPPPQETEQGPLVHSYIRYGQGGRKKKGKRKGERDERGTIPRAIDGTGLSVANLCLRRGASAINSTIDRRIRSASAGL